jgi:hypothetical protein
LAAATATADDDKPQAEVAPPQEERAALGKRVANYLRGFWRR